MLLGIVVGVAVFAASVVTVAVVAGAVIVVVAVGRVLAWKGRGLAVVLRTAVWGEGVGGR